MPVTYGTPLPPDVSDAATKGELRIRVDKLILDETAINSNADMFMAATQNPHNHNSNGAMRSPNKFTIPIDHCAVAPLFWGEPRPSVHITPSTPAENRGTFTIVHPIKVDSVTFDHYLRQMSTSPHRGMQLEVFVPSSYSGRAAFPVGKAIVNLEDLSPRQPVSGWFTVGTPLLSTRGADGGAVGSQHPTVVPVGRVKLNIIVVFFARPERAAGATRASKQGSRARSLSAGDKGATDTVGQSRTNATPGHTERLGTSPTPSPPAGGHTKPLEGDQRKEEEGGQGNRLTTTTSASPLPLGAAAEVPPPQPALYSSSDGLWTDARQGDENRDGGLYRGPQTRPPPPLPPSGGNAARNTVVSGPEVLTAGASGAACNEAEARGGTCLGQEDGGGGGCLRRETALGSSGGVVNPSSPAGASLLDHILQRGQALQQRMADAIAAPAQVTAGGVSSLPPSLGRPSPHIDESTTHAVVSEVRERWSAENALQRLDRIGLSLRPGVEGYGPLLQLEDETALLGATAPSGGGGHDDFVARGRTTEKVVNAVDEDDRSTLYTSADSEDERFTVQLRKDVAQRSAAVTAPSSPRQIEGASFAEGADPGSVGENTTLSRPGQQQQHQQQEEGEEEEEEEHVLLGHVDDTKEGAGAGDGSSGAARSPPGPPPPLRQASAACQPRDHQLTLVSLVFSNISFASTAATSDLQEMRLSVSLSRDVSTAVPNTGPFSSYVHPIPLAQQRICLSFTVSAFSEERSKLVVEVFKVRSRPVLPPGTALLPHDPTQLPREIVSETPLGLCIIGLYKQERDIAVTDPVQNALNAHAHMVLDLTSVPPPRRGRLAGRDKTGNAPQRGGGHGLGHHDNDEQQWEGGAAEQKNEPSALTSTWIRGGDVSNAGRDASRGDHLAVSEHRKHHPHHCHPHRVEQDSGAARGRRRRLDGRPSSSSSSSSSSLREGFGTVSTRKAKSGTPLATAMVMDGSHPHASSSLQLLSALKGSRETSQAEALTFLPVEEIDHNAMSTTAPSTATIARPQRSLSRHPFSGLHSAHRGSATPRSPEEGDPSDPASARPRGSQDVGREGGASASPTTQQRLGSCAEIGSGAGSSGTPRMAEEAFWPSSRLPGRYRLHIAIMSAKQVPHVAVMGGEDDSGRVRHLTSAAATAREQLEAGSRMVLQPPPAPAGSMVLFDSQRHRFQPPNLFVVVEEIFSGVDGHAANTGVVPDWIVEASTGGTFDRTNVIPASNRPRYEYECIISMPQESVALTHSPVLCHAAGDQLKANARRAAQESGGARVLAAEPPSAALPKKPCLRELQLTLWHSIEADDPAHRPRQDGQSEEEFFWANAAYLGECRVDLRPLKHLSSLQGYYRATATGAPPLQDLPKLPTLSSSCVGYIHLAVSLLPPDAKAWQAAQQEQHAARRSRPPSQGLPYHDGSGSPSPHVTTLAEEAGG